MRNITRSSSSTGRSDRTLGTAALVLLAAMLAFALSALRDEWVVHSSFVAMRDQAGEVPGTQVPSWRKEDPDEIPPRAALLRALVLSREASAAQTQELRAAKLADARRTLAPALAARHDWGEAWIVAAFIEFLDHGQFAPATLRAHARSYDGAPYLYESAPWRIRYAAESWRFLDPRTKARAIDEAVWMSWMPGKGHSQVQALVAGTEAEQAYRQARKIDQPRAASGTR